METVKNDQTNDEFLILSNEHLVTLLTYIFNSVPELLDEIAPDGFQNTVFHRYYMRIMKRDFEHYKKHEKLESKRTGIKQPLQSFKQFCLAHNQKDGTFDMEIIMLLSTCLDYMFDRNSFVHDNKGGTYQRRYGNAFSECLTKAILKTDNFKQQISKETESFFHNSPFSELTKRNIPVFRFIFKKLKEKNHDFQYGTLPRKASEHLFGMFSKILTEAAKNKPQEGLDHEKNVLADLKTKQKKQELAEQQNENPGEYFIKKLGDFKPPPIIEAYFDIYGDWPKGYPPISLTR